MKRTDASPETSWIALCLSPHIGAKTLANLLRHFKGDLSAAVSAQPSELLRVHGIGEVSARHIQTIDLDRTARQVQHWRSQGVASLTRTNAEYPPPLRARADAPPLIFAQGQLDADLWNAPVAIVGTRQPSKEARFIALQLARKLARHGSVVVSGLALGIDAAAHSGALAAGGRTIAVLGSGLLNVYPAANRDLAKRIRACGALISALHPRWGANAQRLVARNRIISGLSQAVILVESRLDGGAMYTARFAQEQGCPVYAVNLPASGNQALLDAGAVAIEPDDPFACLPGLVGGK